MTGFIDGAANATFCIFQAADEEFAAIFFDDRGAARSRPDLRDRRSLVVIRIVSIRSSIRSKEGSPEQKNDAVGSETQRRL